MVMRRLRYWKALWLWFWETPVWMREDIGKGETFRQNARLLQLRYEARKPQLKDF